MPEPSAIDTALYGYLAADAPLRALMTNGVFFDEAPQGSLRFVIVSLVAHRDELVFGGRGFEDATYLVKAVVFATTDGTGAVAAKNAEARIDALLEDAQIPVPGFSAATVNRVERVRRLEPDDFDKSTRWLHRGGRYRVIAAPVTV